MSHIDTVRTSNEHTDGSSWSKKRSTRCETPLTSSEPSNSSTTWSLPLCARACHIKFEICQLHTVQGEFQTRHLIHWKKAHPKKISWIRRPDEWPTPLEKSSHRLSSVTWACWLKFWAKRCKNMYPCTQQAGRRCRFRCPHRQSLLRLSLNFSHHFLAVVRADIMLLRELWKNYHTEKQKKCMKNSGGNYFSTCHTVLKPQQPKHFIPPIFLKNISVFDFVFQKNVCLVWNSPCTIWEHEHTARRTQRTTDLVGLKSNLAKALTSRSNLGPCGHDIDRQELQGQRT